MPAGQKYPVGQLSAEVMLVFGHLKPAGQISQEGARSTGLNVPGLQGWGSPCPTPVNFPAGVLNALGVLLLVGQKYPASHRPDGAGEELPWQKEPGGHKMQAVSADSAGVGKYFPIGHGVG